MKILFVADARSSISRNWIENLVKRGHDIHVISSYPCAPNIIAGATTHQIPIAFSPLARIGHNGAVGTERHRVPLKGALASLRVGALSRLSLVLRSWVSPLELQRHVPTAHELITRISPDLVHAMRIPFEGILAARATPPAIPLLISVWGNDFTLFADRNPLIARQTRQTLRRADALLCDCQRDLRLAKRAWRFASGKPAIVLPGAGGVRTSVFHPEESESVLRDQMEIADDAPIIFNPRGFRGYVRNDVFFRAIPLVLKEHPQSVFICSGMKTNPIAEKLISRLRIGGNVRLLPVVEHDQMARLFRLAQIAVSPSLHDGTPNSLLEAMACGCFPVAGDIESVREWITDGENGLLCDPTSTDSVASAILRALEDHELRNRARAHNLKQVVDRADSKKVTVEAESFYHRVVQRAHSSVPV
jgi:glycosyltransferase involved in cell wall biosynthesis